MTPACAGLVKRRRLDRLLKSTFNYQCWKFHT